MRLQLPPLTARQRRDMHSELIRLAARVLSLRCWEDCEHDEQTRLTAIAIRELADSMTKRKAQP